MAPAADRAGFVAAALLGTTLSMAITGFSYGVGNNLFHLIMIGHLFDEPQFAADAFVQSMRFYAAGPFYLLEGSDRYIAPEHLFFILSVLSRLLTFVGFLACACLLGISSRRHQLIFAALIACSLLLQGYSLGGLGGLFIPVFTHSEIDNGLLLLTIYFAARGRLTAAFALNGLVFFTNAFVAVWNAAPLLLIILVLLYNRRLTLRRVLIDGGVGLVFFLILASPVIANVVSNPEYGHALDFRYQSFLADYYPFHFLFSSINARQRLGLTAAILTAAAAFFELSSRRIDVFQAALWGYVLVYAAGIAAPYFTDRPAILNLHLLRSSTGIQLLAGLGGAALATRWLSSPERPYSRVFGPLLAVTLCSLRPLLVLAPFIIVATILPPVRRQVPNRLLTGRPLTPMLLALLLLAIWPTTMWLHQKEHSAQRAQTAQWEALGAWARQNTPLDAIFMVPVTDIIPLSDPKPGASFGEGAETFDYVSHRRVWVDTKRGAAAMWSPSYHAIWRRRMDEQVPLSSLGQKLDYAARNGVSYVADKCERSSAAQAVFQAGEVCLFEVKPLIPGNLSSTAG